MYLFRQNNSHFFLGPKWKLRTSQINHEKWLFYEYTLVLACHQIDGDKWSF